MHGPDKRRIQRIDLDQPIAATFLSSEVTLVDLSTAGARIEHAAPMKAGRTSRLAFDFQGAPVSVQCLVVRSRLQKSGIHPGAIVYHTGLRFVDPTEASRAAVRQIVAGIAQAYEPEQVVGRRIIVVANLKPARIRGIESNGMLLAGDLDGRPILAGFDEDVPLGTRVR